MVLTPGSKVHIITRRLFERDLRRHFVGSVEEVTEVLARVTGRAFVYDETETEFVRRDDTRTRIFSLSDSGLIVTVLPSDTNVEQVVYRIDAQGRRMVTDDAAMSLNVTEFGPER